MNRVEDKRIVTPDGMTHNVWRLGLKTLSLLCEYADFNTPYEEVCKFSHAALVTSKQVTCLGCLAALFKDKGYIR